MGLPEALAGGMDMLELSTLVRTLAADPSSWLAASLAGWDYPLDHTAIAVLNLIDLTGSAHSERRRWRPVPRPWDAQNREQWGGTDLPVAFVIAELERRRQGIRLSMDSGRPRDQRGRFVSITST